MVSTIDSPFIPSTATLSHLCDDPIYEKEIPYKIWTDSVSESVQRTNVKLNIAPDCPLTNIRNIDKKPELETWGFEWMHQEFPYHTGLHNADYVELTTQVQRDVLDRYLSCMSDFLREKLECAKVICWDWRVNMLWSFVHTVIPPNELSRLDAPR